MKIYLILLSISIISFAIIGLESAAYVKKNYRKRRDRHIPFTERISALLKAVIITALIIPNIAPLLIDIFAHDTFIEILKRAYSTSEYYEPLEH